MIKVQCLRKLSEKTDLHELISEVKIEIKGNQIQTNILLNN